MKYSGACHPGACHLGAWHWLSTNVSRETLVMADECSCHKVTWNMSAGGAVTRQSRFFSVFVQVKSGARHASIELAEVKLSESSSVFVGVGQPDQKGACTYL